MPGAIHYGWRMVLWLKYWTVLWEIWVQSQILLQFPCVTMSKLFNLSVPRFSFGKRGIIPFPFFHPSFSQVCFFFPVVCSSHLQDIENRPAIGVWRCYKTRNNHWVLHLIFLYSYFKLRKIRKAWWFECWLFILSDLLVPESSMAKKLKQDLVKCHCK